MTSADADLWVGIDLGTQGARAVVVTSTGEPVGHGSRPVRSRRDGNCHEQDPQDWWDAVCGACREALDGVVPGAVRAVATDSTSGTVLLTDADGKALGPALMYDDSRARDQAARADNAGEGLWRSLGYRMTPSWGLPKLLRMLDSGAEPTPGTRLAHGCDYVNRQLTGSVVSTDWSHALKTGYDLVENAWPRAVLDELGVPEALLPDVVAPGSVLAEVNEHGAAQSAIPRGTPVIAGMTDGCAAQIAAGALREGAWSSTLGTTLSLKGASAELVRDPGGVLYCHRSPDGGWLPGGACNAGAATLSDTFPDADLDELGDRAAERESTDLLAYPLAQTGERFPFDAPQAEGFLIGRPDDDAEHFAALLQGLAFIERLCFDYITLLGAPVTGAIGLTGGATRGRYFSQLRADVLGHPVRLFESSDPATGMAILAASQRRRLVDTAEEMVRVREVIEPREDRRELFLERYLRLVAELEKRGWLGTELAGHARERAAA